MKVKTIIGSEAAYACISEHNYSMDVRLNGGRSIQKSLRDSADELRQEAARKITMAERMEKAAHQLDKDGR